jgi:hypothetical protein
VSFSVLHEIGHFVSAAGQQRTKRVPIPAHLGVGPYSLLILLVVELVNLRSVLAFTMV